MVNHSLPNWIKRFIRLCCPENLHEQILGDLEEYHNEKQSTTSKIMLNVNLIYQALMFFHPYFLFRRKKSSKPKSIGLVANYLKASKRTLIRNPLHTGINVLGLSIGITACITIFTIIQYDLSFNTELPDKDRVYRLYTQHMGAMGGYNRGVPIPLAEHINENFTGIEQVVKILTGSFVTHVEKSNGSLKKIQGRQTFAFTIPEYFEFLPYEFIAGTKESINEPHKVILLESRARLYFEDMSNSEILGQTIYYQDSLAMEVSGIVKDLPFRSDFNFTDFLSYKTIESSWLKDMYSPEWGSINSSTQLFIKLLEGTRLEDIKIQLAKASDFADEADGDINWRNKFITQPISELHFNNDLGIFDNSPRSSNKDTLEIMMLVGLAILLLAVINFVNLETAVAVRRAKEVGVRKILGSSKTQLVFQFLNESYIVTLIAILISLPLAKFCLSIYSDFIPEGLEFIVFRIDTLLLILAFLVFVGTIAGFYPAFTLSSMDPNQSIKISAGGRRGSRNSLMRKTLTIFQFSFSQILIILSIIAVSQTRFMFDKKLGFSTDNVLCFNTLYDGRDEEKDILRNELSSIVGIDKILQYNYPPIRTGWSRTQIRFISESGEETPTFAYIKGGDSTYIDFFEMNLLAGRNIRENSTMKEIIINEAYANEIGFTDYNKILNQNLYRGDDTLRIVGVVQNIHFRSLHHKIEPMTVSIYNDGRYFGAKLNKEANTQEVIAKIEDAFKKVYPDQVFNSFYMEDVKDQFYKSESQTIKIVASSMIIAILISCLGLFALASYSTEQKTKEIGIRKVLGSSSNKIARLLMSEYLLFVTISFFIAVPIGYFLSILWLQDFAYAIGVKPWIFLLTGSASLIIAFITVGHKSYRAAIRNPVDSLRYE